MDDDDSGTPGRLTHLDSSGAARMVDVGEKAVTERMARASARIRMKRETLQTLLDGAAKKGDVLAVARIAGIQAAKKTSDLIPLCHLLPLSGCEVKFTPEAEDGSLRVVATVRCVGRTGVEMEALTAVSVASLTVYDMLKAIDRGIVIESLMLDEKTGGKSGRFLRS